jgi:hypothetical protein
MKSRFENAICFIGHMRGCLQAYGCAVPASATSTSGACTGYRSGSRKGKSDDTPMRGTNPAGARKPAHFRRPRRAAHYVPQPEQRMTRRLVTSALATVRASLPGLEQARGSSFLAEVGCPRAELFWAGCLVWEPGATRNPPSVRRTLAQPPASTHHRRGRTPSANDGGEVRRRLPPLTVRSVHPANTCRGALGDGRPFGFTTRK